MSRLEYSFDRAQAQRDRQTPTEEPEESIVERKIENECERADMERDLEMR